MLNKEILMNFSDKEFVKQLKLLFSSLFSRAMTKVVVGCPGFKDNEFIFSNIKLEEIQMYEPDPAYFIHKVEVLDTHFLEDLFEVFPFFKDTCCLLFSDKFLSTIGKHVGNIKDIKIFSNNENIDLCVTTANNTPLVVTCAQIISEHDARQYNRVFESALIDQTAEYVQDITESIDGKSDYSVIDLNYFKDRICKFVHPLKGYVSLAEYPNKAVLLDFTYTAHVTNDKTSLRVNTHFTSPSVNVTSVQPSMIWFTKPKDKENKK